MNIAKEFAKKIIYFFWVFSGRLSPMVGFTSGEKLTVLITYFNPIRLRHVNHQIRNLLKCNFIGQVIISNHNPRLRIEEFVKVSDPRLVLLNQDVQHGCGHRWLVATQFSPTYLIVMDDDILLFPWQIRKLFAALLTELDVPHGFAGMMQQQDGSLDYHQKADQAVDYLCEIYAITGQMLNQYIQLKDQIATGPEIAQSIESTADFVIVSQTGALKPRIHYVGHLLRCPTFNQAGVAVHKEQEFLKDVHSVAHALNNVKRQVSP
jgi:hypothetical protein